MVEGIGADRVVDYTKEDFTRGGERYDVLLDNVGNRSLSECRRVLHPRGVYIASFGHPEKLWLGPFRRVLWMTLLSPFVSHKLVVLNTRRTREALLDLIERKGVKVLILRQICALSPEKKAKKLFEVSVDNAVCLGENCGCNRLCTRVFKCPGLIWDEDAQAAHIDEVICSGCGVCADICPSGAILRKEAA